MQKLKGLGKIIEDEIALLKKDITILETHNMSPSLYHSQLRDKIGIILWTVLHRDADIKSALEYFDYYSLNRIQFIRDHPELEKTVREMSANDYRSWLLKEFVFEDLYNESKYLL